MNRRSTVLLAGVMLAGAGSLAAQRDRPPAGPRVIDRIVAVVGTTPILQSQLEEQFVLAQSQGAKVPDDSAGRDAARRQLLSQMVDEEILVQQAEHDTSVKVTDGEVEAEVEKTVDNVQKQFTSQVEFETQLHTAGFASLEEWRRWLTTNQRRTILQQRLIDDLRSQNKLRPIPPTDAQMKKFWEENAAQRPKHPALVSFRQIVIAVHPDSGARARAIAQAESLIVALRRGANFAEVAKKFSADTGSRVQGGELGWFRRGAMVKSFEDAAFHLRPGEISNVVETQYGFHIIQVERIQPAEIEARHILIAPTITPAQVALTKVLADSVRAAWLAGAPFDTLARRYADPNEARLVDEMQAPDLPADYPKTLTTDSTRGIKPVFQIDSSTGRPKFVVLEVTKWQPEGELTFDDVRDRIRDQLGQQLAVRHYLELQRRTTYIEILY